MVLPVRAVDTGAAVSESPARKLRRWLRVPTVDAVAVIEAKIDFARSDIARLTDRIEQLEKEIRKTKDSGITRFRSRF